MGIHGLSKLIGDNAPKAVKESDIKAYEGRKIAVDASMSIYQFLIAVRQVSMFQSIVVKIRTLKYYQQNGDTLTNEDGETTRFSSIHIPSMIAQFYLLTPSLILIRNRESHAPMHMQPFVWHVLSHHSHDWQRPQADICVRRQATCDEVGR